MSSPRTENLRVLRLIKLIKSFKGDQRKLVKPGQTCSEGVDSVVNLENQEDVKLFLRRLGLIKEDVVRAAVIALRNGSSRYDLWAPGTRRNGEKRSPICVRGTANKIFDVYKSGQFGSYIDYLDRVEEAAKGPGSKRNEEEPTQDAAAAQSSQLASPEEFVGDIPEGATNGPGLKGKIGEEPIQDARDDQGEDGAQELNVSSGKCHESEEEPAEVKPLRPWALTYLGEVVDSEWSLDELEQRGVPTKEAHRLLEAYARCCEWRWLFPLVNNKEFLTICFDLKVYREYVGIPRKLVNNYSFRFSRALDLDAQEEVQRIDRSLAHYSKNPMSTYWSTPSSGGAQRTEF